MANSRSRRSSGRGGGRPKKVSSRRYPARTSSAREEKRGAGLVRLNKYLADHGVASRRGCDALIEEGKVSVDGEPVVELGIKIDPTVQEVEVGGRVLRAEGNARQYYLLNKPQGVVCTNERRETRPRAIDRCMQRFWANKFGACGGPRAIVGGRCIALLALSGGSVRSF